MHYQVIYTAKNPDSHPSCAGKMIFPTEELALKWVEKWIDSIAKYEFVKVTDVDETRDVSNPQDKPVGTMGSSLGST